MTHTFKEQGFHDKLRDLKTAASWLSQLGVTYFNSRIDRYMRDLQSLVDARATQPDFNIFADDRFPKWVNSIYEATELVSIHKGLSQIDPSSGLASRLKKFTEGPDFAASEKPTASSNFPRDVAFELFMASMLARAGYSLDFGTEADIIASDAVSTFFIECKRPRSANSVNGSIKGAASQLRRRYRAFESKDSTYGVVALSIDNVANPQHFILTTPDELTLGADLTEMSKKFFFAAWRHWKSIEDEQTVGIVTLHQTIAFPEKYGIITSCNFISGEQAPKVTPERLAVFAQLYKGLQSSILHSHDGDIRSQAN